MVRFNTSYKKIFSLLIALAVTTAVFSAAWAQQGAAEAGAPVSPAGISALFTLRGLDVDGEEEVWIDAKPLAGLKGGLTVSDIIIAVFGEEGYAQTGAADGYIRSVITPEGFELGEMYGGLVNSGWLFKVNGQIPVVGMDTCAVEDGDDILLFFTLDFMDEFEDWGEWDDWDGDAAEAGDSAGGGNGAGGGARPGAANPYIDVSEDDWYYEYVLYAYEEGLMLGIGGGLFLPGAPINRAMFATILYRYEGSPEITAPNPFTDVEDGQWYTDAAIWIYGYSTADEALDFGVDEGVEYSEFINILYDYMMMKIIFSFDDLEELVEYGESTDLLMDTDDAMQWARVNGFLPEGGAPDDDDIITRADAAVILARCVSKFNAELG